MQDFSELESILDYNFKDISWLKLALTHRSYDRENNERLEFVGDSILDYIIAVNLYNRYPRLAEGNLSKIKAALVNQVTLVELATKIGLGKYLFLGPGEERSGGRKRPSIIADALEAVFAAIVFDSNMYQAIRVIESLYDEYMDDAESLISKDYKSILQEHVQKHKMKLPIYELQGTEGPDHNNVFIVECIIPELGIKVPARGRSKKEASQVAAEKALNLINSKGYF